MKRWAIVSVIIPDLIQKEEQKKEEQSKLDALLKFGFEPFAVAEKQIWFRKEEDWIE